MYACKCLNIRIHTESPPPGSTQPKSQDSQFKFVYVPCDGIATTHPQLTLQESGKPLRGDNASQPTRLITLSCLVCNFQAYRVLQQIPSSDNDRSNGLDIPSKKNIPEQVIQSHDGWTQVNQDSLTGEAISAAEKEERFSRVFRIVIPKQDGPAPRSPLFENETLGSPSSVTSLFSDRPLFPPSPFSPKHPAFLHLAAVAEQHSSGLRSEAESAIRTKLREVRLAEEQLRSHAEMIWTTYNVHLREVEKMAVHNDVPSSQPAPQTHGAAVAVRDFVPQPVSPNKKAPSGHKRVSSLSASLKTSHLHTAASEMVSTSPGMDNTPDIGLTRGSPKSLPKNGPSSVLHFRRVKDDDTDVAVSYKVLLLEEERAKYLRERQEAADPLPPSSSLGTKNDTISPPPPPPPPARPTASTQGGAQPLSSKSPPGKAKRTVKFDITVPGNSEISQPEPQTPPNGDRDEELVFDLEEEDGRYIVPTRPTESAGEPPAISNPRANPRPTRPKQSGTNLPHSYVSLRPASLPAPSVLRRVKNKTNGVASEKRPAVVESPQAQPIPEDEEDDARYKEISELVGGNLPSHRGLWRKGGPAWQRVVEGKSIPGRQESGNSFEVPSSLEFETDHSGFVVGSMPIPVHSFIRRDVQTELTVASYQTTSLTATSQSVPTGRSMSSRSIRRAIYAERDRVRAIDPGYLNLVEEEDGEEVDELPELSEDQKDEKADRAKQTALKILQKGAEIPDASMWRSLAD